MVMGHGLPKDFIMAQAAVAEGQVLEEEDLDEMRAIKQEDEVEVKVDEVGEVKETPVQSLQEIAPTFSTTSPWLKIHGDICSFFSPPE